MSFPDLDKSFKVFVGHMDPVDELSGVKARLIHLGYLIPPPQEHLGPDIPGAAAPAEGDDEALIKAAVCAFQKAKGLAGNGEVDDDTRTALVAAHGS